MSESKSEIEKMREAFDLAEDYYIIPKTDSPEKWVEMEGKHYCLARHKLKWR